MAAPPARVAIQSQLPGDAERRGWRVDVAGVGYLGTFRRSQHSVRWFAGQHRWHKLGIAAR